MTKDKSRAQPKYTRASKSKHTHVKIDPHNEKAISYNSPINPLTQNKENECQRL